jgi:cullin 3
MEEEDRVQSYLHPQSQEKIIREFLKEYIENHAVTLLRMENSGLEAMLRQQQFNDIKLMHGLFRKVPAALDAFKSELKAYIVKEGTKLVKGEDIVSDLQSVASVSGKPQPQGPSQSEELIKQIIEFREQMMKLLHKSLDRDTSVELAIKNSFESFINQGDKIARALVTYLDEQFKKDFKNNSEVEIQEKVDKVI